MSQSKNRARSYIHIFFVTAITAAGGMFIFKLFSFLKTIKKDELAGFAFDPIMVYAFVAMGFHPPAGGLGALKWQFVLGILLAAAGGTLVSLYKPS